MNSFQRLLQEVRGCRICSAHIEPRPIVQAHPNARVIIVGQAPGRKVHESGIPWDDASGDRLREWLGLPKEIFYDEEQVAIVPMGFCYPGKADSGDLPPRRECAPAWHGKIFSHLAKGPLYLLVGRYAQTYYLKKAIKPTLTNTVRAWRAYLPDFIPLPHPSPLNNIWLSKNPWFKREISEVRRAVEQRLR